MDLNTLFTEIMAVADADLATLEAEAQDQALYLHPLKLATQARQNALGAYNLEALRLLRALRDHMKAGPGAYRSGAQQVAALDEQWQKIVAVMLYKQYVASGYRQQSIGVDDIDAAEKSGFTQVVVNVKMHDIELTLATPEEATAMVIKHAAKGKL